MGCDVAVYADVSVPYLDGDVRDAVADLLGNGWTPEAFRSGTVLATASVGGEIVGCALARRAPDDPPLPPSPGLRALGPDRYAEWLAGGLELTGVVVRAGRRSAGIGASLVDAVLTPARRRRGWAQLTGIARSGPWLRRRGWAVVAADRDGTGAVLLDPRHPVLQRQPGVGRQLSGVW